MKLKLPQLTEDQKKFLKLVEIAGSPNATMEEILEADRNALKIYLSMGFSKKDAYDAFKKIFNAPDKERLNIVHKFIDDYKKDK